MQSRYNLRYILQTDKEKYTVFDFYINNTLQIYLIFRPVTVFLQEQKLIKT